MAWGQEITVPWLDISLRLVCDTLKRKLALEFFLDALGLIIKKEAEKMTF